MHIDWTVVLIVLLVVVLLPDLLGVIIACAVIGLLFLIGSWAVVICAICIPIALIYKKFNKGK